MSKFNITSTVPGTVHLFGEYASCFGAQGIAFAIKQQLSVKVSPAEYEFHVVDGFKLDPKKHDIFSKSVEKLGAAEYLEFSTSSQIPFITGIGTQTALNLGITSLLLEIKKIAKEEKDPALKKKRFTRNIYAKKACSIECTDDTPTTPLGVITGVYGGVVILNDNSEDAIWSLKNQDINGDEIGQFAHSHSIDTFKDVPLVIGYFDNNTTSQSTTDQARPLFNDTKSNKKKRSKELTKTNLTGWDNKHTEQIPVKLRRLISKSGFAKDNLRDMSKLVRESYKPIIIGDLNKLGELMQRNLNFITILGVFPPALKKLTQAVEKYSYGVSLVGTRGDAILILPKDPENIADKIMEAGGTALITKMSKDGLAIVRN